MKTIQMSEQTKSLLGKLQQRYKAKRLFIKPDSPKLHQDSELTSLLAEIFEALSRDIQKHFKAKAGGSTKGRVLHNLKVQIDYVVPEENTIYSGVWDDESETCYELGASWLS
jgi:hypothetical protein